ncbi:MAG: TIGR03617 family F420-dependent LLM class oxidoreductase [Pseudomonadales bacterium]
MRVLGSLITDMASVPEAARLLEEGGYDGAFTAEISNDPFFPLVLAAEHSQRVQLMSSIAVAFARNPMTMANLAHDLNAYSEGRFVLGIGSQIKPHITKRMSMPWSKPAARMREFVLAMRAIWDNWYGGVPLDFRGEFYQHTLMTPMFVPKELSFGPPQVKVAAVGPLMTQVAGEVADGMIAHGFTTAKYLREVSLPALDKGLLKAGKSRSDFDICSPIMVVSGTTEEAMAANKQTVKTQLAFYGSTPAYKPVLDLHGWGDIQPELNTMSRAGQWMEMAELIEDDILNAFAVVAEPDKIATELNDRYGGLVDSWQCTYNHPDPDVQLSIIRQLQQG